jgi:hypothetical protein
VYCFSQCMVCIQSTHKMYSNFLHLSVLHKYYTHHVFFSHVQCAYKVCPPAIWGCIFSVKLSLCAWCASKVHTNKATCLDCLVCIVIHCPLQSFPHNIVSVCVPSVCTWSVKSHVPATNSLAVVIVTAKFQC